MKVLQVFNRYQEKGGEELSVERVSNVISTRHRVFHCYFDSISWMNETDVIDRLTQALRIFYNPPAVRRFKLQMKACNPDVILMHNIFPVGSIGVYWAAIRSGIPVLHYIHNFRPFSVNGYLWANERLETAGLKKNFLPEILAGSWQNSRLKTALYALVIWTMHAAGIYRKFDGWLAISGFMRDVFVKAGVPAEKVFLLRHSWEMPSAPSAPSAPGESPVPYFLFLGRITEAKGIRVLVEAWRYVAAENPEARLVIGGDGPAAEWLSAEIRANERIAFKGFVSGEEKKRLLQGCEAMLVTSEWWEPLGLVVYEAYQYQRPVVAARSGGLMETVVDGQTGWLYPPSNSRALADCVLDVLQAPAEASRRGIEGFAWMGKHSRNSDWLEDFEKIADVVISRHGIGRALKPTDAPDQPVDFSIVTASFRQIPYLSRCAASVADQGGGLVVEHLVHDGCSGDDFDQWAASQNFASCVSEKDEGMYDAINRGFRRAQGAFLAWLNCDEQYLPGALAQVKTWFEKNPDIDILFGDVILITPEGIPLAYRKAIKPLQGHIRSCFLPTYSAATFIRKKVIDQGFLVDTQYRAIADGVWIDGLLSAGFKVGVLNQPLAVFTQTGENLGQSPLAHDENLAWRSRMGRSQAAQRLIWSAVHRLRKFCAGAYWKRTVRINIFDLTARSRVPQEARVGERWVTHVKDDGMNDINLAISSPAQAKSQISISVYLADQNPKLGRSLGISRMTELMLQALDRSQYIRLTGISSESSIQMLGSNKAAVLPWNTRGALRRILTDNLHPLFRSGQTPDGYYFPKGFLPRLHWLCSPSVVTIHDTIIQYYSDVYPKWRTKMEYRYWASMLKYTLRHATCILTVSESAKTQIRTFMERHGIPEKEIRVTYEPCLYESLPQPTEVTKEDYVIHLASREPHKRTAHLIQWWHEAEMRGDALPTLHLIGTVPSEVAHLLTSAQRIVGQPFLKESALEDAYRQARVLILPSEIEGFGLPALEAYYLGTPVCYVKGTSVEEVLRPATAKGGFNLDDAASLFSALDEVMTMSPEEVKQCGLKLRETYAAEKVVERMIYAFRRVAAGSFGRQS